MKLLFLCYVICAGATVAVASDATVQSGSVAMETSATPTMFLYVPFKTFPSAFAQVPVVYAWVRNGLAGSGQFRSQVTAVDLSGFAVTVTRYDVYSGWDWTPSLEWQAQVETEAMHEVLGSSSSGVLTTRITFTLPYSGTPIVDAWARGSPDYPDQFSVATSNVDATGYDVTVTRTDSQGSGWSQNVDLYWTAEVVEPTIEEQTNALGDGPVASVFNVPDPVWVFTPALSEPSTDSFDVLGREVHMTTVRQMLVENTQGRFPVSQTTTSVTRLQVTIRGDVVYLDDSIELQGLKKVTIKARQLVSNGETLTLKAPDICDTMDGSKCYHLTKAQDMSDGKDGKGGIDSPKVEMYLHETLGNINIVSQGSSGNPPEAGGDGTAGVDNTWETAGLDNSQTCGDKCGDLFGELHYKGYPGPNGGNGADAMKAGSAGSGGKSSSLTLYTENLSGYVNLKQQPGTGGVPAGHGLGGRGGYGGTGGCGRVCHAWLMCIIIICWPECNSDPECGQDRGDPGINGQPGLDGFQQYPAPFMGGIGEIEESSMRLTPSVKTWFQGDLDLLEVIRRHAESLFQRNDNDQALDAFNFILSVTDPSSALHQEVSLRVEMIDEGFDYYGHTEQYAPDLDWSYLSARSDSLLESGKVYEDAYNSVMNGIQDITTVSATMQSVITLAITTEDRELANNEVELKSAKNLYVKSLRQLERGMKSEVLQINVLVPLAIVQDKFHDTVPALIGGIAGFVEGLIFLDPVEAFNGAMQVLDVLFGKPDCDAPTIREAAATLQERLDFGYDFKKINPEDLDFTTMDVSAVPVIMLSDLAKNKELLNKELECLYGNPDSDVVKNLERVINDFYRDAALRIVLIDRIMNIDVQLKEIGYNRDLLAETQASVDAAVEATESSIAIGVKMSFTDLLFSMYQEQENVIMRSIYELSKAYQFSCLWNFNALDKYNNFFGDEVMTSNLGSLEGMFELELIRQELEDEKDVFLNLIASSAGPASHSFNAMWEFDLVTHPELFDSIWTEGQFTLGLELDANDVTSSGCQDCYNGRLVALYVELSGEDQPSSVPNTIYIKVAHMGDSSFLLPTEDGSQYVELLQQTPENVDGGHIMTFNPSDPVTSAQDPALDAKFLRQEYRFCDNADDFFGTKPCKSPYASYVITIPRNDELVCTLDPNQIVSGTNCQDLDYTKFSNIKVFAKVKSWSDYPAQPDPATMKSYLEKMKAERNEEL